MNIKTLVSNGVLAALYIAVSMLIQPFGFTNVQFRISEMFNHLIVFNRKYIYGIVMGVILTNLLFSPMKAYDLIFGVAHSLISLMIIIYLGRYIKSHYGLMLANTCIFTFNMFLIAIELKLAFGLPFFFTWLTTAVGEFAVMLVGIPVILAIHKRVRFDKLI